MNWLFVLSESLLVLRSKQSGKYWEGSTYKYSSTYSVQGAVVLEYIELSRQCFCPQLSRRRWWHGFFIVFTNFAPTSAVMGKEYFTIKVLRNDHTKWKIWALLSRM